MSFMITLGLMLTTALSPQTQPPTVPNPPAPPVTYGSAAVEAVHSVNADYTVICDIADFPPVVGKEIPVRIRGLDREGDTPNPLLLQFLRETLVDRSSEPNVPSILLREIQRGPTFCLVADVEVSGEDLGALLVEKGLVRRVFRVPPADPPQVPPAVLPVADAPRTVPPKALPAAENPASGFVASRTGKVFHRPDCYHAKRIAEDRLVRFATRREAEASGRRPCKSCSP